MTIAACYQYPMMTQAYSNTSNLNYTSNFPLQKEIQTNIAKGKNSKIAQTTSTGFPLMLCTLNQNESYKEKNIMGKVEAADTAKLFLIWI